MDYDTVSVCDNLSILLIGYTVYASLSVCVWSNSSKTNEQNYMIFGEQIDGIQGSA